MKIIVTHNYPLIKRVMELHSSKGRKTHCEFIAEGTRTITTLVSAGMVLKNLFIVEPVMHAHYDELQPLQKKYTSDTYFVSESVMQKMSAAVSPSGVLAVFSIPRQPSLDQLTSGVVLANVQDPGNVGTLIRTAAAMGKKTVACIGGADPWSPKVVQSTAGTIGFVNVFDISFEMLVTHKKDIQLCALVVDGGISPDAINLSKALIVVGSEAHGIPQEWVDQCDCAVTLSMPGKCESLNAAVAGSIALYLAATQHATEVNR